MIRIVVLNRHVCEYILGAEEHIQTIYRQIRAESAINSMLVARIFCNMFKSFNDSTSSASNSKIAHFLLTNRQEVIKRLNELSSSDNKSFQIAFSTLLLNYVILIKQLAAQLQNGTAAKGLDAASINEVMIEFVQYLNELASVVLNWDAEALFRVFVTFGTLVSRTDSQLDYEFILTVAKSLDSFPLACQEVNAKAQKFPQKVTSCVSFLFKEFK